MGMTLTNKYGENCQTCVPLVKNLAEVLINKTVRRALVYNVSGRVGKGMRSKPDLNIVQFKNIF